MLKTDKHAIEKIMRYDSNLWRELMFIALIYHAEHKMTRAEYDRTMAEHGFTSDSMDEWLLDNGYLASY